MLHFLTLSQKVLYMSVYICACIWHICELYTYTHVYAHMCIYAHRHTYMQVYCLQNSN